MEEEREDNDRTAWSVEEISQVMEISQKEIKEIQKHALLKLRPHLAGIRYG